VPGEWSTPLPPGLREDVTDDEIDAWTDGMDALI
jgi:hypothetical protein